MFLSDFVEWWTQHRVFQNNQSGPILLIHFTLDCWQRDMGPHEVVLGEAAVLVLQAAPSLGVLWKRGGVKEGAGIDQVVQFAETSLRKALQ